MDERGAASLLISHQYLSSSAFICGSNGRSVARKAPMPPPSLSDLLSVATEAAYLAGRRTLAYFNTGVAVEIKADDTPVTRADRESEQLIRERIARSFPE